MPQLLGIPKGSMRRYPEFFGAHAAIHVQPTQALKAEESKAQKSHEPESNNDTNQCHKKLKPNHTGHCIQHPWVLSSRPMIASFFSINVISCFSSKKYVAISDENRQAQVRNCETADRSIPQDIARPLAPTKIDTESTMPGYADMRRKIQKPLFRRPTLLPYSRKRAG